MSELNIYQENYIWNLSVSIMMNDLQAQYRKLKILHQKWTQKLWKLIVKIISAIFLIWHFLPNPNHKAVETILHEHKKSCLRWQQLQKSVNKWFIKMLTKVLTFIKLYIYIKSILCTCTNKKLFRYSWAFESLMLFWSFGHWVINFSFCFLWMSSC